MNQFQSSILTAVVQPRSAPTITWNWLADAVGKGRYRFVTSDPTGWQFEQIAFSKQQHYVELRAAVLATNADGKQNLIKRVATDEEALDLADGGGYLMLLQNDLRPWRLVKEYSNLHVVSVRKQTTCVRANATLLFNALPNCRVHLRSRNLRL